jgi:hypothetical protein
MVVLVISGLMMVALSGMILHPGYQRLYLRFWSGAPSWAGRWTARHLRLFGRTVLALGLAMLIAGLIVGLVNA